MKMITVVGARPQFIKAAAVSRAIEEHNRLASSDSQRISETIIHTGQHFDENMSDIFFRELQIPKPDFNLGVNSLSHGAMTGQMLEKIEKILTASSPDWVLVYGDTNSTLAGALAAAKLHIPVAHVEAGLRSFNRKMPEELNRILTDHVSTFLFCPTKTAVKNLSSEGIKDGVKLVGDVMFDVFLFYHGIIDNKSSIFKELGIEKKEYYLATVHREENTDDQDRLYSILKSFEEIGTPTCPVVFPMHPRTRKKVAVNKLSANANGSVIFVDPVGYLEMIALEAQAITIFTDSGGVQKEAYFASVPCVTLRNETEWIETVEEGVNIVAGTEKQRILESFKYISTKTCNFNAGLFGDAESSKKIVQLLSQG